MAQIAVYRLRPPLFHEYHRIAEEIYAKYLVDGSRPAPTALSPSAHRTLSEHKEIRYTTRDGLAYRYDKPYPSNIPFTGLVTFGLCWGGEKGLIEESQPPETLIENAKMRAPK
jgi:hypothetical protein